MRDSFRILRLQQLDRGLPAMKDANIPPQPPGGWVASVREALGLTLEEVAHRLRTRRANVLRFEKYQARERITLHNLRRVAEAMDCQLVYALIPKSGSFVDLPEKPVRDLALRRCRKRRAHDGIGGSKAQKHQTINRGGGSAAPQPQEEINALMNFILENKLADGNTPIRKEEAEQLIPRISTIGELNEYEALNIVHAKEWAFSERTMKSKKPLEETYVRELHKRMFGEVWKWAGTYELNIGCDPREITQRSTQVVGNAQLAGPQYLFYPIDSNQACFAPK